FLPALLGFGVLIALLHRDAPGPRAAFVRGTAFGFGFFLAGLYWVGIAFFADAQRFGLYAVPAVLGLALFLALTVGLAAALVSLRRWRSVEARALAFAVAWTLAEPLRGGLGLQFPWNPIAVVWAVSDATLQATAFLGTYGLSLVTVAAAGLTAPLFLPERPLPRAPLIIASALILGIIGSGILRLTWASEVADTAVRLRLVQANIAQHHKWDPAKRLQWFQHHIELSARPAAPPPQIVIWPESAVPYDIDGQPEVRAYLAPVVPPGGALFVGGDRYQFDQEPPVAHNTLFALGSGAQVLARYDKVNLVPFGEFLPIRSVLGQLGLGKLTEGSIDFQPGKGRVSLRVDDLPPASPLICYEAAFPAAATDPADRPAWLVNITNDAWFGRSSGPYQHLAMARMRAVEEGLPLVRAANTGISVVTDAYGRVRERLGLNRTGVIDAWLPGALPQASFARRHLLPVTLGLLLLAMADSVLIERRSLRSPEIGE
ncbi:MAG: apolipoprotein N-acyltransferase, partial [Geminicoccaceae bacterium]